MSTTEPLDLDSIWDRSTSYMALWDAVADQPTPEQVAAAVATAEDVRTLLAGVERLNAANAALIGPLTAGEWCEFRQRDEDDLLQCCGVTSDVRDAIFGLLRNGAPQWESSALVMEFADMLDHGLPEGRGGELLAKLRAYYLPEMTDAAIHERAAKMRATLERIRQEEGATR